MVSVFPSLSYVSSVPFSLLFNRCTAPSEDVWEINGAQLGAETVRAAKNLDDSINTLVRNFGDASDYFKILVNVFQSVLLNNDNHEHLKNFYIIGTHSFAWISISFWISHLGSSCVQLTCVEVVLFYCMFACFQL